MNKSPCSFVSLLMSNDLVCLYTTQITLSFKSLHISCCRYPRLERIQREEEVWESLILYAIYKRIFSARQVVCHSSDKRMYYHSCEPEPHTPKQDNPHSDICYLSHTELKNNLNCITDKFFEGFINEWYMLN